MLPVSNPTASYWRREPHWLDQYRSTEQLPTQADIVIIGAGIAGVSTAYHLANRYRSDDVLQPSIVLVEAREVCSGATGRNGGHIKKLPSTVQELIDYHGSTDAGEIIEFVRSNMYGVKSVIEREGIKAEAELRRSFDVSLTKDDADTVQQNFQKQLRTGFPLIEDIDYVGEKSAERVTLIHGAKAGLSTPVLSLWPYKFVTQLLERAMAKGNINLQTRTPVTAIDSGSIHTVHTPRGSVRSPVVVHATNGYAAGLLSHCIDYLNPRPDGSIVVGGGKWTYQGNHRLWYNNYDDSTLIEPARYYFDGLMQQNFRGWEDSGAVTDSIWTGIQGITHDGMPHIGKVPGTVGQFVLAGYNGGGMALAFMAAQGVARMINEGIEFVETDIPRVMKTTKARLRLHNPAC
ncbi:FAD dependent oxidoreductase [Aspergillus filifer]